MINIFLISMKLFILNYILLSKKLRHRTRFKN